MTAMVIHRCFARLLQNRTYHSYAASERRVSGQSGRRARSKSAGASVQRGPRKERYAEMSQIAPFDRSICSQTMLHTDGDKARTCTISFFADSHCPSTAFTVSCHGFQQRIIVQTLPSATVREWSLRPNLITPQSDVAIGRSTLPIYWVTMRIWIQLRHPTPSCRRFHHYQMLPYHECNNVRTLPGAPSSHVFSCQALSLRDPPCPNARSPARPLLVRCRPARSPAIATRLDCQ